MVSSVDIKDLSKFQISTSGVILNDPYLEKKFQGAVSLHSPSQGEANGLHRMWNSTADIQQNTNLVFRAVTNGLSEYQITEESSTKVVLLR
jgi:hypothetical protein